VSFAVVWKTTTEKFVTKKSRLTRRAKNIGYRHVKNSTPDSIIEFQTNYIMLSVLFAHNNNENNNDADDDDDDYNVNDVVGILKIANFFSVGYRDATYGRPSVHSKTIELQPRIS
jgi:hypothetical protein